MRDVVMGTSTPILLAMLSNRIRPCETSSVMYLERTEVGLTPYLWIQSIRKNSL